MGEVRHRQHHDHVHEQAQHDRWRRQQDVVQETNRGAEPGAVRVFGQEGAGHDPHRRADRKRDQVHDQAADDGVGKAALVGIGGDLREQFEVQRSDAVLHRDPEDPDEEHETQRGGATAEHHGHHVDRVPTEMDGGHHTPSRRASWRSIRRETRSTTKVTTNSRKPSAISAERCVPTASLNSLAMEEEMEVPGISSDEVMLYALPSTKVTAIVSPRARPSPRKMPPITAERVYGSTMSHTTSHVVEPSA